MYVTYTHTTIKLFIWFIKNVHETCCVFLHPREELWCYGRHSSVEAPHQLTDIMQTRSDDAMDFLLYRPENVVREKTRINRLYTFITKIDKATGVIHSYKSVLRLKVFQTYVFIILLTNIE